MPAIERSIQLLDAAMGTRMIDLGLDLAVEDPSAWCLDHPQTIFDLHAADVQAGAEGVMTNTFCANRVWLARTGQGDRAIAINRAAVALARRAVGLDALVFASIGPTATDDPAAMIEQAQALVDAGADALVLETHRLDQVLRNLATLRLLGPSIPPIIASLYLWPETVHDAARQLTDAGAQALGANCVIGTRLAVDLARKLREASSLPLLIKPSAGRLGTRLETPDDFGSIIPDLIEAGVTWVGGCCGTTAEHIAAMRQAITRSK